MHLDDEALAGLALGEAPEAGQEAHLVTCAECQATLDELRNVLGMARADLPLEEPSAHVWDSVLRQVSGEGSELPPAPASEEATVVPLQRRPPGSVTRWLAAGVATAAAVAGAFWFTARNAPDEVAYVALQTLDTKQELGTARLLSAGSGKELEIDTAGFDPRDGYLEVWLINKDLARMVSVGVLDAKEQTFVVPQRLLDEGYVVVDISREPLDDKPAHSGDSIVRGALPI